MEINQFFTDILGANLRNPRWSWGAVDPMTNRVFLRVWEDSIDRTGNADRIVVDVDVPRRQSNGYSERKAHVDLIRDGAMAYGVLCTAVDPDTTEARAIESFDETTLLRLGELTHENRTTYAGIDARVPVSELARSQTGQSTLADDLKTIANKKVDATTTGALVNARVGQGRFRSQVQELWGNACSVTGSTTLDVIRASHIKPWRFSNDNERLDPANGLPLVASLDALFDAGLISFDSSGALIVSSRLPEPERDIFGVNGRSLAHPPSDSTAEYLAYHRDHILRK